MAIVVHELPESSDTNAHIKHYVTKSLQEWVENKMRRGTGDRDYNTFVQTYKSRYFMYNQLTQPKLDYLKSIEGI